jgi:hypothetical protein
VSVCLLVCLSVSIYLSIYLSVSVSICLSVCLCLSIYLSIYLFIPVAPTWRISIHETLVSFQFLRQSVELLGRGISPSLGRYIHRTTQTQNKSRQTSMPRVWFEPTTPVFERAKTVHASDRAAIVVGAANSSTLNIMHLGPAFHDMQ